MSHLTQHEKRSPKPKPKARSSKLCALKDAMLKAQCNNHYAMIDDVKGTMPEPNSREWIHLQSGKEFSRLLYTNPVCFLGTTSRPAKTAAEDKDDGKVPSESTHTNIDRNVMVLSWLTASNNNGRFLFSIHKTRYSAELLTRQRECNGNEGGGEKSVQYAIGAEFSLSVPVKGMEEMVKDVGSISGRRCTKFQSDMTVTSLQQQPDDACDHLSNRQRKKQKKENIINNGIVGLIPVSLGSSDDTLLEEFELFAIKGTVAHLKCRVYALIGPSLSTNENASNVTVDITQPAIDDDHLLIMAEVIDAYVHRSYWDSNKLLFRPMTTIYPPYLTFFGSQSFGYVASSS